MTVLAILPSAFLLAYGLMFVYPTGSLFVFFGGLGFAGAAAVLRWLLHRTESAAAHREQRGG